MEQVRVGIIGIGAIAEATHLTFLKQHPEALVKAVVDLSIDRAKEMADKHNIPHYFKTVEEMFAKTVVDAVIICTPNQTHMQIAKKAAEHGVHVLVEKPIGTSLQEVDEYLKTAKKANTITMVGMTHRFRNDAAIVKRYVEKKEFGELYYAKAKLFRRRGAPKGWFTNKELAGGGAMMDIGVHALDLAWWLLGSPSVQSVSGQTTKALGAYQTKHVSTWESKNKELNAQHVFDVEDFGAAWIRFTNGIVLSLEIAWAVNGEQDDGIQLEILGNKGGAKLAPLTIYKEEQDGLFMTSHPQHDNNDPFKAEIDHFIDCIRLNKTPLITGENGYEILRMLQAIYESSEKQKEIYFN
ncbi:gfo/Idh/MocA family oxidoreductase [Ornithinibacillus sp. L9]|uniref:Gfo/Idh/MocA family oxidoreductase n=1 Tax=Ornithinibacillus caprae TaxID=2678566 RepID=A0A6N8FCI9_9BACI|nr:gfo/Idh/MocA family oxidoreductase [Ornithinibacillus caprae]